MNILKLICFLILFCSLSNLQAQEMTKEERKVQIFSHEEKDNLQLWFHKELKRMNFSEEELDHYNSVILYYISKIARLDDKDKEFTKEKFKIELNKLLLKQETELKEMLSPERYAIHTEIYGEFLRSAYKRWGITP